MPPARPLWQKRWRGIWRAAGGLGLTTARDARARPRPSTLAGRARRARRAGRWRRFPAAGRRSILPHITPAHGDVTRLAGLRAAGRQHDDGRKRDDAYMLAAGGSRRQLASPPLTISALVFDGRPGAGEATTPLFEVGAP